MPLYLFSSIFWVLTQTFVVQSPSKYMFPCHYRIYRNIGRKKKAWIINQLDWPKYLKGIDWATATCPRSCVGRLFLLRNPFAAYLTIDQWCRHKIQLVEYLDLVGFQEISIAFSYSCLEWVCFASNKGIILPSYWVFPRSLWKLTSAIHPCREEKYSGPGGLWA